MRAVSRTGSRGRSCTALTQGEGLSFPQSGLEEDVGLQLCSARTRSQPLLPTLFDSKPRGDLGQGSQGQHPGVGPACVGVSAPAAVHSGTPGGHAPSLPRGGARLGRGCSPPTGRAPGSAAAPRGVGTTGQRPSTVRGGGGGHLLRSLCSSGRRGFVVEKGFLGLKVWGDTRRPFAETLIAVRWECWPRRKGRGDPSTADRCSRCFWV